MLRDITENLQRRDVRLPSNDTLVCGKRNFELLPITRHAEKAD